VLALGFTRKDMFTDRLTTPAMMAIACASHPGTAVYHSITEGWTTEAHLLANLSEQQAGLVELQARHDRPGVADLRPSKPVSIHAAPAGRIAFDVTTIAEFVAAERAKKPRG
jgi:hypothetical protein